MNKTIDALKVPATAQEWTDLTEDQLCALAVHFRVILQTQPGSDKQVIAAWNKMPVELYYKFSRYVIKTASEEPRGPVRTCPWVVQAEAVKKFGLI